MSVWTQLKEFHQAFRLAQNPEPDLPVFTSKEEVLPALQSIARTLDHISQNSPTFDARMLRIKLLLEEVAEYIHAELDDDIVEVADALTDIIYIAAGTEIAYGIPGEDIFNHIHDNNMSKLDGQGNPIYREDGKVLKPNDYVPPNIQQYFKKEEV